MISNNRNTNMRWDYNLYSETQKVVTGPNDLVAESLFVKVARDLRDADFSLGSGNPALNSGTKEFLQSPDLAGQKRPLGRGPDRGAYEQR